jgi:hypothetical protein
MHVPQRSHHVAFTVTARQPPRNGRASGFHVLDGKIVRATLIAWRGPTINVGLCRSWTVLIVVENAIRLAVDWLATTPFDGQVLLCPENGTDCEEISAS